MSDIDEGRLPESAISRLVRTSGVKLEGLPTGEIVALIEEALELLPAEELMGVRDTAERMRQAKLEGAKNDIVEEMRVRLAKLGLSLDAALPSQSRSGSRRTRRDAGIPIPIKYRGQRAKPGRGAVAYLIG